MDSAHLAVALVPLSLYLLRQAFLNLSRHPRVVSGYRDASFLMLGIAGCILAGPLELFFPESAAYVYGPFAWFLLFGLYLLAGSLAIMLMRPRLVIYNAHREQVVPLLQGWLRELDPLSTWAGDNAIAPQLRLQLHLEYHPLTHNLQLISTGYYQDFEGWHKLQHKLRVELANIRAPRVGIGLAIFALSLALLAYVSVAVMSDQQNTVAMLREMLRIY